MFISKINLYSYYLRKITHCHRSYPSHQILMVNSRKKIKNGHTVDIEIDSLIITVGKYSGYKYRREIHIEYNGFLGV